jgi:hypothetical protein
MEGVAGLFGSGTGLEPAPAVDVKVLHTKACPWA